MFLIKFWAEHGERVLTPASDRRQSYHKSDEIGWDYGLTVDPGVVLRPTPVRIGLDCVVLIRCFCRQSRQQQALNQGENHGASTIGTGKNRRARESSRFVPTDSCGLRGRSLMDTLACELWSREALRGAMNLGDLALGWSGKAEDVLFQWQAGSRASKLWRRKISGATGFVVYTKKSKEQKRKIETECINLGHELTGAHFWKVWKIQI
jgi:hypothetical protein